MGCLHFWVYVPWRNVFRLWRQVIQLNRDITPQVVAVDNIRDPQILKVYLKCSKMDLFREGTDRQSIHGILKRVAIYQYDGYTKVGQESTDRGNHVLAILPS